MNYHFIVGEEAKKLLADKNFQQQWDRLYQDCLWATSFQSFSYSSIWYEEYSSHYEPVLALSYDAEDRLINLFPLARHIATQSVVCSGDNQTEYKAWLSSEDDSSSFFTQCMEDIKGINANDVFQMEYMPSQFVEYFNSLKLDHLNYAVEIKKNPLVKFNTTPEPWASLKKKSNKSRLSRLKKVGELKIKLYNFSGQQKPEISGVELINMVKDSYDIRQGAMNSVLPFLDDNNKLAFFSRLLEESPDFRAIIMYLGDDFLASIIGPINKDGRLSNCIISHNPLFAKHSPGKFVIFMASQILHQDGVESLDLTPGGDAWKDRFANHYEEVGVGSFYLTPYRQWIDQGKDRIRGIAKQLLVKADIKPDTIKEKIAVLKTLKSDQLKILNEIKSHQIKALKELRSNPLTALKELRTNSLNAISRPSHKEHKPQTLYALPTDKAKAVEKNSILEVNNLSNYLKFNPDEIFSEKDSFFQHVLKKMQEGAQGYSYVEKSYLKCIFWLAHSQKSQYFPSLDKSYDYESAGSVIQSYYSNGFQKSEDNEDKILNAYQQVIHVAAATNSDQPYIYTWLKEYSPLEIHVLETLGFEKMIAV